MLARASLGRAQAALPRIDLWAAVGTAHLPKGIRDAFDREDWPALKEELRPVMDAVTTDGVYGRELLQLVRKLPIGIEPIFDRYRAMASIDFGDWDSVERCLAAAPNDPIEIRGMRDVMLASLGETWIPAWTEPHHRFMFQIYNLQFGQLVGGYKRWAREVVAFRPTQIWARGDMPMGRHVRYRQLHDAFSMAIAEALSGRLGAAAAIAGEGQHLGDEGEPLRTVCRDLEQLSAAAMGDSVPEALLTWEVIAGPTGCSPLSSWQWSNYLVPLVAASRHPTLEWVVDLLDHVALGFASPRAQLHATTWRAALKVVAGGPAPRELRAVLAEARHAGPGLRVLPLLLAAIVDQDENGFREAERAARRVRNVWAQVSALVWSMALAPSELLARRTEAVLRVSGWRRPAFVPSEIAGRAAHELFRAGVRCDSALDLAAVSAPPEVALDVASRYVDDPAVPLALKRRAMDVIASTDLANARAHLRTATRDKALGAYADDLIPKPDRPFGLSEREHEVLMLAGEGLKNREIATRLVLSPHTIARHLANARTKLSAANRTEAAIRLRGYRAR